MAPHALARPNQPLVPEVSNDILFDEITRVEGRLLTQLTTFESASMAEPYVPVGVRAQNKLDRADSLRKLQNAASADAAV